MEYAHHHGTATTTASNTRPGTPDSDPIEPVSRPNPFATPYGSMPPSAMGSTTGFQMHNAPRYFHSRRIVKGQAERPWLNKKDPKEKWVTIIPIIGIFLGLAVSGVLIWEGLQTVHNFKYCTVLDEHWSNGFNDKIWTKEVEAGGYGNGQFEVTTNTDENAFVKDGMLHIKPTLQDASLITSDTKINLTTDGSCTSTVAKNCYMETNLKNGTIVNPVRSARISTKVSSIKFGRIEVTAKLPAGDWLWPAIWMLPVNNTYGEWPKSGEIDIMESRGNNYTYAQGGNNIVSSTIHWGLDSTNDGWYQNNNKRQALHTTYAAGFNTFGLEWSEKYMFTYIGTRLLQVMYVNFDKPFWAKGNFPLTNVNGTRFDDPWSYTGRKSTPFDEEFYLIINLAVGGTNGWFEDGKSNKPWVNSSPNAKKDFWDSQKQWLPTWEKNSEMIVKNVKIMQQAGFKSCPK